MFRHDRIRLHGAEGADLPAEQFFNEDLAAPSVPGYREAYARPAYEAPQDQIETVLAEIWGELLGVQPVSRHDNFFALGGHSLLAVRVANRVQSVLGVELPLSTFFVQATLTKLGETILEILALRRCRALRPVTPASREGGVLSLSFAQQRLWFLSQLDGASTTYQSSVALRLNGSLDAPTLRRSLDQIFSRHEVLRSVFVTVDGQPRVQLLSPEAGIPWLEHDLRSLSDPQAELERLGGEETCLPFDLSGGPMIRVRLIRIAEGEHILLLTQHHIVSDGWSIEVLFRELSALYHAFIHKQPNPLPALAIQFPDYAAMQSQWLASERLTTQSKYWRHNLTDAPVLLTLPSDRPRSPQQSLAGASIGISIDAELAQDIRRLSQRHGTTLFMTLLTAWAAALARLSGQDNVVIGVPAVNRSRPDIEDLVGPLVNTLPLRIDLSGEPTVAELLARVRTVVLGALDHQNIPVEQLSENASLPGHLDHAPLFQVMFAWHNADEGGFQLPGLTVESVDLAASNIGFDLELSLRQAGRVVEGVMKYSKALFDASSVERHRGYFVNVLKGMVDDGNQLIMNIEILDGAERELLLNTWNQTEAPYSEHLCIHQLFEEQVRQNPESIAVISEDRSLRYAQLNSQANHLACQLIALGVKPNSKVAICADRNPAMVVALLAVLKAGGAYVPLDLSYPVQRLAYMLEDADPVLLLADAAGRRAVGQSLALPPVVDLETVLQGEHPSGLNPEPNALGLTSSHLAYVVYTSGSTGIPKGVMVPHRAVCSRLTELCSRYGFSRHDRVLQFSPISFDGSVEEIFCSLVSGSAIVLRTDAWLAGPVAFWALCEKYRVTVVDLPTRFWQEMAESNVPKIPVCIRLVIISGEAVSRHALEVWSRRDGHLPQVLNVYGPTETTIIATIQELDRTSSCWNSIGRPIANTRIYLLDGSGKPVPLGAVGEVYIGGAGVTLGYLNKPSLTAERFVDDPFSRVSGRCMYRTGDQARYLSNGNLEFLGRNDQQIKIRGFRVEPGEIETRLSQHPLVRQAAVVAHEGTSGDKRLIAYITLSEAAPQELSLELRTFLSAVLPEYMLPVAFVPLDALPLNPNGKLDRKRLPAPEREAYAHQLYEPPQGPIETGLAKIWAELLGLHRVSRHDDFFELGGHSLLAVKFISQVRLSMATDVSLLQLIGHSTVSSFALCVLAGQKRDESWSPPRDLGNSQAQLDRDYDERLFSVRLPFELNAPLRTFLSDAYPLGILWNATSFKEWILHFNVNLAFCLPQHGFDGIPLAHHLLFPIPRSNLAHWREMGFLDFQVYDFEFLEAYQDNHLLDFLSKQVREGYYLLIYSDEYYLSLRRHSRHIRHEALIVGLSDETSSFLVAAYDQAGEYKFITQRFDAVIRALKSTYTEERPFLITISPKQKIPQAEIVRALIGQQIDDYLNSRPSSTQYPWIDVAENWRVYPANSELAFGMACYDEVAKYLAAYVDKPKEIDPRCTRLLWEHKKLMSLRLEYLADVITHPGMNGVKLAFKEVEKTARLIHQLACVDYMSDNEGGRIDSARVRELILFAKRKEGEVLIKIRDALSADKDGHSTTAHFTADESEIIRRDTEGWKLHPLEVILSKRKLQRALGREVKEWASCLVEGGYESRSVRALANLVADPYPPLMEPYVDRVLKYLGISDIDGSDALILYCRYLIDQCLDRQISAETLYARLAYLRRQHESSYGVRELNDLSTVGNLSNPVQRSRMVQRLKALVQAYHRVTKIETEVFPVAPLFTDFLSERQRDLWIAGPIAGHTIDICKNTLLAAEDSISSWHCCTSWQRKLSNKLNAKEFASKLGVNVARLYWCGNTAAAIPFSDLPRSFVLKATTGWNSIRVLPIVDRSDAFTGQALTDNEIRSRLSAMLANARKTDGRIEDEDRSYDDATIFAEEFLRDRNGSGVPDDYKCYCFSGRVAYIQVIRRRTQVWYTPDWNIVQDAMLALYTRGTPTSAPENLSEMITIAEELSAAYEYPFVRVDLYNTLDGVYFGEFTHTPYAGMSKPLYTPHANETMGRLWFDALAL